MIRMVIGGCYGSESKGKTSVYLAQKYGCDLAVRSGGPNAGHVCFPNGNKYVARQLPSPLAVPGVHLGISAGGMVGWDLLMQEISALRLFGCDVTNRLVIDRFASVVESTASSQEKEIGMNDRLGSTQTGTGATQAARVMRTARVAKDLPELAPYLSDVTYLINTLYDQGKNVILEGTQGFGLGTYHGGCYPFCTSRDTSASGFASEMGVSPRIVGNIYMVMRTFPIRVAGNSGPMANEIDWATVTRESGSPHDLTEMTSVTKRVRRVARFDFELLQRAVMVNRPTHLVLACMDHVNYEDRDETDPSKLSKISKDFIKAVEAVAGVRVAYAFTGPSQDSICDMEEM